MHLKQIMLKRVTRIIVAASFLAIAQMASGASPVPMKTEGEFLFPSTMSEDEACEAARQRGIENAVRRLRGELISAEEQFSCKETLGSVTDSANCTFNRSVWSQLDGEVRSSFVTRRVVSEVENTPGVRRCFIELDVLIDARPKSSDPNFDFSVSLSKSVFLPGENLQMQITANSRINLVVFSWIPGQDKDVARKIFPNAFDPSPLIESTRLIPKQTLENRYRFEVSFPNNFDRDFSDEYLLFIATKREVRWLDSYDMKDLKDRLRELDPKEKRVHRRAYRVVRGS